MSDPQTGGPDPSGLPPAPGPLGPFPPPPGSEPAPVPPATGQWAPGSVDQPAPSTAPGSVTKASIGGWVLLAIAALLLLLLGLSIPEDDFVGWEVGAWAAFAVACCVAVFVPLFGTAFNLSAERAWKVAAVGAGGLFVFWLLLIVPRISQNTSFLVTAATAAAVGAVWLAPGRPVPPR